MPRTNSKAARQLAALRGAPKTSRPSSQQAPESPCNNALPCLLQAISKHTTAESKMLATPLLASEKIKSAASKTDGAPDARLALPSTNKGQLCSGERDGS